MGSEAGSPLPFQQEFTSRNNRAAGKRIVNSNNEGTVWRGFQKYCLI